MSDQILRLKCTKFNFGWGSALDPAAGLYRAPRDPLAELRGPTSKGRGREAKGKGRKAMERGGDETPPLHAPPQSIFLDTLLRKSYIIYRTAPFSMTLNDAYPQF